MAQLKIKLITENPLVTHELENTVRAFFPRVILSGEGEALNIIWTFCGGDIEETVLFADKEIFRKTYEIHLLNRQVGEIQTAEKKYAKLALYDVLTSLTCYSLPYGSLTGIRPTKLYYELTGSGFDARKTLTDEYLVNSEKADLIEKTVSNQKGIYKTELEKIDLFINIPICLTKCSYCSFSSIERGKLPKSKLAAYADALKLELEQFYSIFRPSDIRSVYIGGGTPSVLTLEELKKFIPLVATDGVEFTVEAGRPDTIDLDKLKLFKDAGVTRVSVNPQTFNQKTIDIVKRAHTVADIYEKYAMSKSLGFDINMDLIAMLPGETFADFAHSLDCAMSLSPANITVHSLAIKRGSKLILDNYDNTDGELAAAMINYSISKLTAANYEPYYMYRLKNMSGGLENVGYAKSGKQCVYNVDIMEETHSVYAIGSGGISKKVTGDFIEREAASKDIYYYLENFEEMLSKKRSFFTK